MNQDLTFVMSFFRDTGHMVRNVKTVRAFNPNSDHKWILIDNSSGADLSTLENEKPIVYKGADEKYLNAFFLKKASLANATALNFGITKSNTRFICVMDPDFFVVYPNWIEAVLGYMDSAGVGILSAPYHPIWYEKAHRATGHFMVIDTDIIPASMVNFAPSEKQYDSRRRVPPHWLGKRRKLRRAYDCGSQIEELFGSNMEYLVPIYDKKLNPRVGKLDSVLDLILPRELRLTYTEYPSMSANLSGILALVENYFWHGCPFALHLRRYGQGLIGGNVNQMDIDIEKALEQVYMGYKNILEAK